MTHMSLDPFPQDTAFRCKWAQAYFAIPPTPSLNNFTFFLMQGIGSTATDMYTVVTKEHEEKGVTGAVGGVLRQLPGTIVKPIILASEATRHMLGGVKNQFVPDARKEASEKWKSASTND